MSRNDRRRVRRAYKVFKRAMFALSVIGFIHIVGAVGRFDFATETGEVLALSEILKQMAIGGILMVPGTWLLHIDNMIADAEDREEHEHEDA